MLVGLDRGDTAVMHADHTIGDRRDGGIMRHCYRSPALFVISNYYFFIKQTLCIYLAVTLLCSAKRTVGCVLIHILLVSDRMFHHFPVAVFFL